MNILVTGGAGYIGSVVTEALLNKGYSVIVLDNLITGHQGAVSPGATLIVADIGDSKATDNIFRRFNIDAVIHLAAETVVHYSVINPEKFFNNNVTHALNLLNTMIKFNVKKFIFSSSASVYGDGSRKPIKENDSTLPVNSYGESKLIFERILKWYGEAHALKHVSLRYFNVAGASELLGEDHRPETHLIPSILNLSLSKRSPICVCGNDFPTEDGSCVRDFIHVMDIASAHILVLDKLEGLTNTVYNLGNGNGSSVMEIIKTVKRITGIDIPIRITPRRPGDPAILIADGSRIKEDLSWKPMFPELAAIIESAWSWIRKNPNGYG